MEQDLAGISGNEGIKCILCLIQRIGMCDDFCCDRGAADDVIEFGGNVVQIDVPGTVDGQALENDLVGDDRDFLRIVADKAKVTADGCHLHTELLERTKT